MAWWLVVRGISAGIGPTPAKLSVQLTLARFTKRHPASQTAREARDRLSAGVDSGLTARHQFLADQTPILLRKSLNELCRRGRLAAEFNRARIARIQGNALPTEFIKAETGKGDPLAGFYSQWLMPEETPESPPYAWAWNACRYWQESAGSDRWRRLSLQFPKAERETEFLRILEAARHAENQTEVANWCNRYHTDSDAESTATAFMSESLKRVAAMSPQERDESALTVLARGAVDALEFVSERAAQ